MSVGKETQEETEQWEHSREGSSVSNYRTRGYDYEIKQEINNGHHCATKYHFCW